MILYGLIRASNTGVDKAAIRYRAECKCEFALLKFLEQSSEGCHVAKLLGTYEQPIHSHLLNLISRDYEKILNIGCAEGYYAVGLSRLFPSAVSLAFDTDPVARKACENLAAKNRLEKKIEILMRR